MVREIHFHSDLFSGAETPTATGNSHYCRRGEGSTVGKSYQEEETHLLSENVTTVEEEKHQLNVVGEEIHLLCGNLHFCRIEGTSTVKKSYHCRRNTSIVDLTILREQTTVEKKHNCRRGETSTVGKSHYCLGL